MKPINPWILAFRLKTLPAAIAPVGVATAMAVGYGVHNYAIALVALFAAICIQIATNLANDYFDYTKGADTPDRIGPTRVTSSGLIAPQSVRNAMILVFGLAIIASGYLVYHAGWIIAVIGIISVLSGIFYTAGPRPLGYVGLGEVFVFIFFGPVAVAGTFFVQSLELNWAVIIAGIGPGFLSVAILAVNNLRDRLTDKRVGKNTLAVRFGGRFAIDEYFFAVIMAGLTPVLVYVITGQQPWSLLACSVLFMAIPIFKVVVSKHDGPSLNAALASTGKLLLVYSFLFSIGWIIH